jgi:predicted transcriptional regulator of viral defense system
MARIVWHPGTIREAHDAYQWFREEARSGITDQQLRAFTSQIRRAIAGPPPSLEPLAHPDLVMVARRVPQGVLCLISALSFHELTTQVPHTIDVALERGTRKPRLDYPPTRFFWFSGLAFHEGIETHTLDGVSVRIYDPEKTLADGFRYRNQLGKDVVLEALRLWRERRRKKLDVLLKYARMRHVERAMRPYLEAMP